jgi:hypothetical protein
MLKGMKTLIAGFKEISFTKVGHWMYECKAAKAYVQRDSRTQQLKLKPVFHLDLPPGEVSSDYYLPFLSSSSMKRKRSKSSASSSSGSSRSSSDSESSDSNSSTNSSCSDSNSSSTSVSSESSDSRSAEGKFGSSSNDVNVSDLEALRTNQQFVTSEAKLKKRTVKSSRNFEVER